MSVPINMPEMTIDVIRSVPLFASLNDTAAQELRTLLSVRQVPDGTLLFRDQERVNSTGLQNSPS